MRLYLLFSIYFLSIKSVLASGIHCLEAINYHSNGTARCLSGWVEFEPIQPFDISQVDINILGQMYGVGFVIFSIPFVSAWGLSMLLKTIRRS